MRSLAAVSGVPLLQALGSAGAAGGAALADFPLKPGTREDSGEPGQAGPFLRKGVVVGYRYGGRGGGGGGS